MLRPFVVRATIMAAVTAAKVGLYSPTMKNDVGR